MIKLTLPLSPNHKSLLGDSEKRRCDVLKQVALNFGMQL